MNMDGVRGVRQVRIKMKSHRVRIRGLVEETEIRLEGQVEKPGNGIQQSPISEWELVGCVEVRKNSSSLSIMLSTSYCCSQTPEAYVAPPTLEDADPNTLEELYAERDGKDAAYRVAMEAHDEWKIEKEAVVAKARKEAAATEEARKKEE
ncbi:hypothetical protein EDD18DRAFT_1102695 [Armillaria luteobubalina]|uniref:Uncharacterized protein n=1 Tax=Armillaria luteobubalina TaxID=153913 RepID=A0AA39QAK3_9AGAR|nr:hypothetical protein EDD18DRAFT_1102695 [Armillaria luteobubalina]